MLSKTLVALLIVAAILVASTDAQSEDIVNQMYSLEDILRIAEMAGVAGRLQSVLKGVNTNSRITTTLMSTTTSIPTSPTTVYQPSRPRTLSRRRHRPRPGTEGHHPTRYRSWPNAGQHRRPPNLPPNRRTRRQRVVTDHSNRVNNWPDSSQPRQYRNSSMMGSINVLHRSVSEQGSSALGSNTTQASNLASALSTSSDYPVETVSKEEERLRERVLNHTITSLHNFLAQNLNTILKEHHSNVKSQDSRNHEAAAVTGNHATLERIIVDRFEAGTTARKQNMNATIKATQHTTATPDLAVTLPSTLQSYTSTEKATVNGKEDMKMPTITDVFQAIKHELSMSEFINLLETKLNMPIENVVPTTTQSLPIVETTMASATLLTTTYPPTMLSATAAKISTASATTTTTTTKTSTYITTAKMTTSITTVSPITTPTTIVASAKPTTISTVSSRENVKSSKAKNTSAVKGSLKKIVTATKSKNTSSGQKTTKRRSSKKPSKERLLRLLRESNRKRVKILSTYRKMGYHLINRTAVTTTQAPKSVKPSVKQSKPRSSASIPEVPVKEKVKSGIPAVPTSISNILKNKPAEDLTVPELLLLLKLKVKETNSSLIDTARTNQVKQQLSITLKGRAQYSTLKANADHTQAKQKQTSLNKSDRRTGIMQQLRSRMKQRFKSSVTNARIALTTTTPTTTTATIITTTPTTTTTTTTTTTRPTTASTTRRPVTETNKRRASFLLRSNYRRNPKPVRPVRIRATTTPLPVYGPKEDPMHHNAKLVPSQSTSHIVGSHLKDNPERRQGTYGSQQPSSKRGEASAVSNKNQNITDSNNEKQISETPRTTYTHGTRQGNVENKLHPLSLESKTNTFRKETDLTSMLESSPLSTLERIIQMGESNMAALVKSLMGTKKKSLARPLNENPKKPLPSNPEPLSQTSSVAIIPNPNPKQNAQPDVLEITHMIKVEPTASQSHLQPQESFKTTNEIAQIHSSTANSDHNIKQQRSRKLAKHHDALHGGIDVQINEAGEADVIAEPEPEPEFTDTPVQSTQFAVDQPSDNREVATDPPIQQIDTPIANTMTSSNQIELVENILQSVLNSNIVEHMPNVTHIVQPEPIPETLRTDTPILRPYQPRRKDSNRFNGIISLRTLHKKQDFLAKPRVVPPSSAPGKRARDVYYIVQDSARARRVSSQRSMTSVRGNKPGIPTVDISHTATVDNSDALDDMTGGINGKSNRTGTSDRMLKPGRIDQRGQPRFLQPVSNREGVHSVRGTQSLSSPNFDIGMSSGIERNFQTVGRSSHRQTSDAIDNGPMGGTGHARDPYSRGYHQPGQYPTHHSQDVPIQQAFSGSAMDVAQARTLKLDYGQGSIEMSIHNVRPGVVRLVPAANSHNPGVHGTQAASDYSAHDLQPVDQQPSQRRRNIVVESANPRFNNPQHQTGSVGASDVNQAAAPSQGGTDILRNSGHRKPMTRTVYDPESETYVTRRYPANSQNNHHPLHHQQEQLHHHRQEQLHQQRQEQPHQQRFPEQQQHRQQHQRMRNGVFMHDSLTPSRQMNSAHLSMPGMNDHVPVSQGGSHYHRDQHMAHFQQYPNDMRTQHHLQTQQQHLQTQQQHQQQQQQHTAHPTGNEHANRDLMMMMHMI